VDLPLPKGKREKSRRKRNGGAEERDPRRTTIERGYIAATVLDFGGKEVLCGSLLREMSERKKKKLSIDINANIYDNIRPSTMQHSVWVLKRGPTIHVIRFIIRELLRCSQETDFFRKS